MTLPTQRPFAKAVSGRRVVTPRPRAVVCAAGPLLFRQPASTRPALSISRQAVQTSLALPQMDTFLRYLSWDLASCSSSSSDDEAVRLTSTAVGLPPLVHGHRQASVQVRGANKRPGQPCQDALVADVSPLSYLFGSSRPEQVLAPLPSEGLPLSVSAVFDGHGAKERAATHAQDFILYQILRSNYVTEPLWLLTTSDDICSDEISSLHQGFTDVYGNLDRRILEDSCTSLQSYGSTALVVLALGNRLYAANAGDSRAVLCEGGRAVRVSRDHTPDLADERARIESRGGKVVMHRGVPRVHTGSYQAELCAVSRGLGDRVFKDRGLIVSEPDISAYVLQPQVHRFVICASDGLWCVVSDQEAVDAVEQVQREFEQGAAGGGRGACSDDLAKAAADRLLQLALEKGSHDDISIIVNFFEWDSI